MRDVDPFSVRAEVRVVVVPVAPDALVGGWVRTETGAVVVSITAAGSRVVYQSRLGVSDTRPLNLL